MFEKGVVGREQGLKCWYRAKKRGARCGKPGNSLLQKGGIVLNMLQDIKHGDQSIAILGQRMVGVMEFDPRPCLGKRRYLIGSQMNINRIYRPRRLGTKCIDQKTIAAAKIKDHCPRSQPAIGQENLLQGLASGQLPGMTIDGSRTTLSEIHWLVTLNFEELAES